MTPGQKWYSEVRKDPRWQKKRLEILSRDGWTCQHCSAKEKTLHVHHKYYERGHDPWDYPDHAFVTLCEDCHDAEPILVRAAMEEFGPRLTRHLSSRELRALVVLIETSGLDGGGVIRALADGIQCAPRRVAA